MKAIIRDDYDENKIYGEVTFSRRGGVSDKERRPWERKIAEDIGEILDKSKSMMIIGHSEDGEELYYSFKFTQEAGSFSDEFEGNKELDRAAQLAEASAMVHTLIQALGDEYGEEPNDILMKIVAANAIFGQVINSKSSSNMLDEIEKISDKKKRYKEIKKLLKEEGFGDVLDLD